jgi:hypothetical protein
MDQDSLRQGNPAGRNRNTGGSEEKGEEAAASPPDDTIVALVLYSGLRRREGAAAKVRTGLIGTNHRERKRKQDLS